MIQPKHFLIACGGTGGHLSPGIAVAQELTARGHRCKLLISEKRVDQALCGSYPELEFIPLPGIGFSKKLSNLPRCLWAAFKNIVQSFRLLHRTKADAVIGFGGFTNVGIVLAAKFLRKPCFLHEANRIPGRAVRTLGRWATTVYVPEIFQKQQHLRMKVCGFPIRREFQKIDKTVAKQNLGFDPLKPLLVIVGGSQGARVLTQWAREHSGDFKKRDLQVLCLTGVRNDGEGATGTATAFAPVGEIREKCGNKTGQTTKAVISPTKPEIDNDGAIQKTAVISEGGDGTWRNETVASEVNFSDIVDEKNKAFELKTEHIANKGTSSELSDASSSTKPSMSIGLREPYIRFAPFSHQMHLVYSAADAVIGRAGAGTIAELTVCETPSILIPLPTSADGHQRANARAFEQQGGCVCLEQNDLPKLREKVLEFLSDKEKREAMSERLRELHPADATKAMVTDIERALGIG